MQKKKLSNDNFFKNFKKTNYFFLLVFLSSFCNF